eukprot:5396379-Alexandrium_andersonii.AAC.1
MSLPRPHDAEADTCTLPSTTCTVIQPAPPSACRDALYRMRTSCAQPVRHVKPTPATDDPARLRAPAHAP